MSTESSPISCTPTIRIGHGFDVHRFAETATDQSSIWLGGVEIAHEFKLLAHSDGDVALHAICDALLGAIAAGDIGQHFPDTDDRYKNARSTDLLENVNSMVITEGYAVGNVDVTIITQEPKMSPYINEMRTTTAKHLNIASECINYKATTTEHLGYIGEGKGIAVHAVAIIYKSS